MKSYQKWLAVIVSMCMLFSALACGKKPDTTQTPAPEGGEIIISGETEATPAPVPEETALPTLNPTVSKAFQELDAEIFKWYATGDGYQLHMLVEHPENYGIDRSTVPMTLGEFTEEDTQRRAKEAEVYLARLTTLPRSGLTEAEQLSYDVIQQYLTESIENAKYPYYVEPLTEYSGIHGNIPMMFALFEINSMQDAEDYLALFADVPRYLGQVLAYEQKKAENGTFMTEKALEAVLSGCQDIIDSEDSSFLYATFAEAVDALSDASEEQKTALKTRNETLVKNGYINAYRALYDGLNDLKKSCSPYQSVHDRGETAKAYFALQMQGAADSLLTVEEYYEMLKSELYRCQIAVAETGYEHPELYGMDLKVTSGNTDTDLAQLKTITSSILPALPEHQLTVTDVPEELESLMSPAAYAIPAVDGWQKNTILINLSSNDDTYLLTLAHEAYPGHLYQYVYQRGLKDVGLMQQALHYGGYAEAWSQYATQLIVENQTTYNQDYVKLSFYADMMGTLLPAMVSVLVNYYGYDQKGIETFISGLQLNNAEKAAETYYALAIDQPYYFFAYALGYCQIEGMVQDAETDMGATFDRKAYLTAYLNLGPCYFNLIQERMDVWVDAALNDEI